jgi:predicted O-methyltransferase YrrM
MIRALRRAAAAAATPEAAVEAAFRTRVGSTSVVPTQVREEMFEFLTRVREDRPRRVLEIGTDNGGTLYLLAWASAPDARLLSIDIREYDRLRRRLYNSLGRHGQRVTVLRGDSRSHATRAAVERYFRGGPLDLLFIDGDHAYESVRRDYELYAPLVRVGGTVAFHDIVEGPESSVGGVPRFWREVRPSLCHTVEIVHSSDQGGYGIGLGVRAH